MVSLRGPAGLVSAWSSPPYREFRPLPLSGASVRELLPRAAVVVLDAPPDADDSAELADAIRAARGRFPVAPVIIRVPHLSASAIRLA